MSLSSCRRNAEPSNRANDLNSSRSAASSNREDNLSSGNSYQEDINPGEPTILFVKIYEDKIFYGDEDISLEELEEILLKHTNGDALILLNIQDADESAYGEIIGLFRELDVTFYVSGGGNGYEEGYPYEPPSSLIKIHNDKILYEDEEISLERLEEILLKYKDNEYIWEIRDVFQADKSTFDSVIDILKKLNMIFAE